MSSVVLKALFSSQTRVKLLSTFSSIRSRNISFGNSPASSANRSTPSVGELENLRRIGLVKARHKNRKKYYRIDSEFPLFADLRNIFSKEIQAESPVVANLKKLPNVELVLLAGTFTGTESKVDSSSSER